jgi:hypothetical protein
MRLYSSGVSVQGGRRRRLYLDDTPAFSPLIYGPALWLDAAHAGSLLTDGAASFTAASSQYLRDAANGSLSTDGGSFTVGLWVYLTTDGFRQTFAAKGWDEGGDLYEWVVYQDAFTLYFGVRSADGTLNFATRAALPAGTWHFLACWYDATAGTMNLQVDDGAPVTASVTGAVNSAAGHFTLGVNGNLLFPLDGRLDSAGFWLGRTLTPTERTALYNAGAGLIYATLPTGLKANLAGWWDLNEPSGVRHDRSGNGNDLADNNGVGLAAGVASGAAQYDGDPVTTWLDRSGHGNHVTQATASKRLTLALAVQNGRNVVRSDGVDDYLQVLFAALPLPFTVYLAARCRAVFDNATLFDSGSVIGCLVRLNGTNWERLILISIPCAVWATTQHRSLRWMARLRRADPVRACWMGSH